MSRQSAPSSLFSVTRPEDISNLNNTLMALAMDERLRIKATGDTTLIKSVNAYTATVSVTVQVDFSPTVLAAVQVGSKWYPLAYINCAGAATMTMREIITSDVAYSAGVATITFTLNCNSSDYGNALSRPIHYIVLKDKISN